MKKVFSILTACLLTVSMLVGCGSQAATDSDNSVAAGTSSVSKTNSEPVTLRMWGAVPPESGPQKVVDNFNKEFKDKGIQIEYERFVNDDTGNLKLETSLLAGSDIDIYVTYSSQNLSKRAAGNMALDLTELCQRDKFNIPEKFSDMVKAYYYEGKPYSVPTALSQFGMVLNKDMFDAAGIAIPTEWTYDEFRERAKKLTHGEGQDKVYGVFWNTQQNVSEYILYLTNLVLGGDPLYKEGAKETNLDNDVIAKTLELVNNTMNVDKSAPTHVDSVTQKLSQEGMFLSGKSAMTIGPWIIRSVKDTKKYPHSFKTAFAPYPVVSKDQKKYTQGSLGDHVSINPKSKNIDAAWEFVKWYSTGGMMPVVGGGRVPAYLSISKDDVLKEYLKGAEDHIDGASTKAVLIDSKENYAVPTITPKLPEITKVVNEEFEAALTGHKEVKAALADAKTRADKFLK